MWCFYILDAFNTASTSESSTARLCKSSSRLSSGSGKVCRQKSSSSIISTLQASCTNTAIIEPPIVADFEKKEIFFKLSNNNKIKSTSQLDVLKDGTNKTINSSKSIKNFLIKSDLESGIAKTHINDAIFSNSDEKKNITDENLNSSANLLQSLSPNYKLNKEISTYNLATNINAKSENSFVNNSLSFQTNKLKDFKTFDTKSVNNLALQQKKFSLIDSLNQRSKSSLESDKIYSFTPFNYEKKFAHLTENRKDNSSNLLEMNKAILHDSNIPILQAPNLTTNVTKFQVNKNSISKPLYKSQIDKPLLLSKFSSENLNNLLTSETTLKIDDFLSNKKQNLNSLCFNNSSISGLPIQNETIFSSTKGLNNIPDRPPLISQKSTSCIPSSSSQSINRNGFNRLSEGDHNNFDFVVGTESRHHPTESLQERINAYCAAANIPKSINCSSSTRLTRFEFQSKKNDIVSLPLNRNFFSNKK